MGQAGVDHHQVDAPPARATAAKPAATEPASVTSRGMARIRPGKRPRTSRSRPPGGQNLPGSGLLTYLIRQAMAGGS